MTEPGAADLRTKTGALIGTPTYMSPEQCRGGREIGPAADLYALGCILFELVAGRPPFVAAGHGDLIVAHISEPPPALGSLASGVSSELEKLVQRLLFKSPADRPSDLEAAAQLNELAGAHPSRLMALELGLAGFEASSGGSSSSKTLLSPAHVWSTSGSGAPSSPKIPLSSASEHVSIHEPQQSLAEPPASSGRQGLERRPRFRSPILLGAVLLGITLVVVVFASLRSRSAATPRGAFAGDTRVSAASVTPAAVPATAAALERAPLAVGTRSVTGAASATLAPRPATPRLKARQTAPPPALSSSAERARAAPGDNIWGER
jgi:serine/threonine-protein kinase